MLRTTAFQLKSASRWDPAPLESQVQHVVSLMIRRRFAYNSIMIPIRRPLAAPTHSTAAAGKVAFLSLGLRKNNF